MEDTAADGQSRVEQLLRNAHVHKLRQQWGAAETLCRQALELEPDDPLAQEMLGDLLASQGGVDEPLELYKKSFEKQPQKSILEEKIARLVLQKDRDEHERLAAQLLLSSPKAAQHHKRHGTVVLLLSLLCPGVGQFINGDTLKGGILLAVGLSALLLGGWDLAKFGMVMMGVRLPRGEAVNDVMAVVGMVGIAVYIYSLLDAAAQAAKPK